MEEILASIRRIIADDQDDMRSDGHDEAPADERVLNQAEPQIFSSELKPDLSETQISPAVPEPVEPRPYRVEIPASPEGKPVKPQILAERALERVVSPALKRDPASVPEGGLLSEVASHSISQTFGKLGSPTPATSTARTIEDIVREMLRPMLKTWLDENLPPVVERLVREEIERAARSRR
ncbi:DUF2497 domain-containing protein [Microvirga sp. 2MCAF38]|uniref:DUF2497 domain-containing protein n=1 Tax=Microvirga sp. 2MCAF38 TaxID=3232989 RepID=UPI003F9CEAE2